MADIVYAWDAAWTAVTADTTALTDFSMADNATQASDALSLDDHAAAMVSLEWEDQNSGAIDGDVNLYIFRDINGTLYESTGSTYSPFGIVVNVVADTTSGAVIWLDAGQYKSFKVGVTNESGQDGDATLKIIYADITTA